MLHVKPRHRAILLGTGRIPWAEWLRGLTRPSKVKQKPVGPIKTNPPLNMHRRPNNNFSVGYLKFCAADSHRAGYTNVCMHQTVARRNVGIKSSPFENHITRPAGRFTCFSWDAHMVISSSRDTRKKWFATAVEGLTGRMGYPQGHRAGVGANPPGPFTDAGLVRIKNLLQGSKNRQICIS